MKRFVFKCLISIATVGISMFGAQLHLMQTAVAAPGNVDLSIESGIAFNNEGLSNVVCSAGPGTVVSFELNIDATNWESILFAIAPYSTTAANPGSVDEETGMWSGVLENGECIQVVTLGQATAPVGETASITSSIVASTLEDESANVDPNNDNDTSSIEPFVILAAADIALDARLLTGGEIVEGSSVSYQVDVLNIGEGDMPNDPGFPPTLVFVLPPDATFDAVIDLNEADTVSITTDLCQNVGFLADVMGPAFAEFTGDTIVCNIEMPNDVIPVGGPYPFEFVMTAGSEFAAGETEVISVISGGDRDSLAFQQAIAQGTNPLDLENNNFAYLAFDPDELSVTINRCTGQSEVTTDGSGCFRVSFNKLIYAPSFTEADLVLEGGGDVESFNQIDDYTWEVGVVDITPGATLTLLLGAASVQDYSAVTNGVQVLGENSIRYEEQSQESSSSSDSSGQSSESNTELSTEPVSNISDVDQPAGQPQSNNNEEAQNDVVPIENLEDKTTDGESSSSDLKTSLIKNAESLSKQSVLGLVAGYFFHNYLFIISMLLIGVLVAMVNRERTKLNSM